MNYLKRSISLVVILVIGTIVFCLTTTPGLIALTKLANLVLPGNLNITRLDGHLIRKVSFDKLEYTDKNNHIVATHGNLDWDIKIWRQPKITVNALHIDTLKVYLNHAKTTTESGLIPQIPKLPFGMHLNIKALTIDHMAIDSLQLSSVKAQMLVDETQWIIYQIQANHLNYHVELEARGEYIENYPVALKLQVTPLSGGQDMLQGKFSLMGDTSLYTVQGKFYGPFPIEFSGKLQELATHPMINIQIRWGANTLKVSGKIPHQLDIKASIPQPEILHPSLKGLKTRIEVLGGIKQDKGAFTIAVFPGQYQLPQNQHLAVIPFQGGKFVIDVAQLNDVKASGQFVFDAEKKLDFILHLPHVNFDQITTLTQPIEGKLNFYINSLSFLQELSEDINHLHGKLYGNMFVKGTLKNPNIEGLIQLSEAGMTLPNYGLTLEPIRAELKTHDKEWSLQGTLGSINTQHLDILGHGVFAPQLIGNIIMSGDHFPLMRTKDYIVDISPKLEFNILPNGYRLTGKITVPTAKLTMASFTKTVSLTDDVVFIESAPKASSTSMSMTTDVLVELGDNASVNVQGLQGELEGAIRVKQEPGGELNAIGELNIRNGYYKAYDQNLKIQQGKILFSGGSLTSPAISVRAVREFNSSLSFRGSNQLFDFDSTNIQNLDFNNHLTVGVEVSGHLTSPKIKLFSIPGNLSQADILSLLILGKPANQASKSGGQLLMMAASSMKLSSGSKGEQLVSQLKDKLGFDVNLQMGSQFNQKTYQSEDNTSVVIGKSLSKRLYLSYNIGLYQDDSNVLTLKYLLNKFFSVQVSASDTGNGIDVLYTSSISEDEPQAKVKEK